MFSEKIGCYISAWHDFEMVKLLSPEREVLRIQQGEEKKKKKAAKNKNKPTVAKLERDIKEPFGWIPFSSETVHAGCCFPMSGSLQLCSTWTFVMTAGKITN